MIGVNVGDVIAHLRLDSTQFDIALATAQQRMQSFAASLGRMGSYLTWRVTLPLTLFGRKATKAFAEFDNAITRSAAVTKGMTSIMRKEMADTALALSKKSILSAKELAGGYYALGQAGYNAAQSIKALPVVEDFAIASSTTLDESIRYLVRTVNGLGMASEDPIKNMEALTRVSNAYTYASITTTAEIEDFAIAMTHAAAPALRLVNKSVEEGISVLMAFASAGIQAEEAGTLLWTSTRDLQRANIKARSEWKRLGLTIYDTDGTMRNIADIIGDLEQRFMGMSDEGKKVNLMLLGFQDRSLRGIQALMGFSEQMKIWQEQMKKGGDLTKQIAEAYLKSFSAQLVMVRNNLNTVSISIGRTLAPIIMKVNEKIKEFVEWWEELSDSTRLVIVEIGIVVAVVGPLLIVLSKLVSTVTFLSIGFNVWTASTIGLVKALGLVSLGALGVLGVIALVVGAIYALRAVWEQSTGRVKQNLDSMVEGFRNAFEFIANSVLGEFAKNIVLTFNESFRIIRTNWKTFIADLIGSMKGAIEWTKIFAQAVKESWTLPTMTDFINRVKAGIAEANEAAAQAFSDKWEENLRKVETYTHDAFEVSGTYVKAFVEATVENAEELGRVIKKQFGEDIAKFIDPLINKIIEVNKQFLGLLPSETEQKMIDFVNAQTKIKESLGDTSSEFDVWSMHLREVMKLEDRFAEVAVRAFESTADALTEFVTTGTTDIKKLAAAILTDLLGAIIRAQMAMILQQKTATGQNLWASLAGSVVGGISGMSGGGAKAAEAAYQGGWTGAKGLVFNMGQIIPMAAGDIIGMPSFIPLSQNRTALIGEAGPEAVMPLTRIGGKLGVQATGQGVVVNVINQSGTSLQVSRQETYMMSDQRIVDVVVRRAETDNHLRRAMRINR
jgi:TP901 family phage tail tape measure protein